MFIGVACCECHGVIAKTVHIKVIRWVIRLHLPPPSPRWMFIGSTPYYCSIEYMFEHVFRISVTGMPPCFLWHSVAIAAWSVIQQATDDPFWAFLSPGAHDKFQPPNNICLEYICIWKKISILGFHRKKIIILAPFHELSVTWQT